MLEAVKKEGFVLKDIGSKYSNDPEIIKEAIIHNPYSAIYMDPSLRQNQEIIDVMYNSIWYNTRQRSAIDSININGQMWINYGMGYECADFPEVTKNTKPQEMEGKTKVAKENWIFAEGHPDWKPQLDLCPTITGKVPTKYLYTNECGDNYKEESYSGEEIYNTDEERFFKVMDKLGVLDEWGYLDETEELSEIIGVTGLSYRLAGGDIDEKFDDSALTMYLSATKLVYNTSLPSEINEKLVSAYFHAVQYYDTNPLIDTNFIEYHLDDLVECFGGKEGLISFVTKYGKDDANFIDFDEYIEKLSRDIDEMEREKKENLHQYTPSEIAKGIEPIQSKMNEVMEETTAKEVELDPKAKSQEDNDFTPGGDKG